MPPLPARRGRAGVGRTLRTGVAAADALAGAAYLWATVMALRHAAEVIADAGAGSADAWVAVFFCILLALAAAAALLAAWALFRGPAVRRRVWRAGLALCAGTAAALAAVSLAAVVEALLVDSDALVLLVGLLTLPGGLLLTASAVLLRRAG